MNSDSVTTVARASSNISSTCTVRIADSASTSSHTMRDRTRVVTDVTRYGRSSGSDAPARAASSSSARSMMRLASSTVRMPISRFSSSTTGVTRWVVRTARRAAFSASSDAVTDSGDFIRSRTVIGSAAGPSSCESPSVESPLSAKIRSRMPTTPSSRRWSSVTMSRYTVSAPSPLARTWSNASRGVISGRSRTYSVDM